ncbi:hypothetical protein ODJ79_31820 [Actinoplanes sp. KI2]|uniref:hypothetical protein n=1 Tax=Actinoplanes sp. KI2 TaxID=2983315 RepID=UPI0021D5BB75|nr:hypothetical protein [Actinoplanes sp. KI2]MCU7728325.1 hypothetical protein [Actinoplanes sp. KI2]
MSGNLDMDVYDYTFAAVDLPNWAHQIGLSPWSGWGAAVNFHSHRNDDRGR